MPIVDWTAYTDGGTSFSNPQGIISTDTDTPIVGTGSVVMTAGASDDPQSMNVVPGTFPTGYRSGYVQTLLRFTQDPLTPATAYTTIGGIICMQDRENISQFGAFGGAGRGYAAGIILQNTVPSRVALYKFTAGGMGNYSLLGTQELTSHVDSGVNFGVVLGLRFTWYADTENLVATGGVYLKVELGQQEDFSDLSTVITYIDSSSPYVTTVAESLWAHMTGVVSETPNKVSFDNTSYYRFATQ
jgi:hypothetical protein